MGPPNPCIGRVAFRNVSQHEKQLSWPQSWSLPWSTIHRIEESVVLQAVVSASRSFLSTDLSLDSRLESSNTENTSFFSTDSSLQFYRAANMSFLSTNSSLQSYYSANTSFISTDSSLQSFYTANSSFISTHSSLQSYCTANASVSSLSSIHSEPTSSRSSDDVSLPYSVNSVNSYKSRKTVLYPRREHPQPVAI